ncbi:hypothetical protein [Ferruginibacter sp.]
MYPGSHKPCTYFFLLTLLLLVCYGGTAQTLQYSRQNIFIDNPDDLQMVADIAGTHHLLKFNNNESPEIFIYNDALEFKKKVKTAFKFPEKASLRIIACDKFYYLCIRPRFSNSYFLWKIDSNGNSVELTDAFRKLLRSQAQNMESGFQLIESDNRLCLLYHTYIPKLEKNVLTYIKTDSVMGISSVRKVMYEFKADQEKLQQEAIVSGRYLLVLKKMNSIMLKVMKVDIATGLAVSNEFTSSGYYYSQCGFTWSNTDSSITISALLTEPTKNYNPRHYIFVSRLNNMLAEQTPFTIFKSQFAKNAGTNFLMVNGASVWNRMRVVWTGMPNQAMDNTIRVYQDITMPCDQQNAMDNNRLLASFNAMNDFDYAEDQRRGVRISMLDKNLKLASDTLIKNNKDSYTLRPEDFTRFNCNGKDHLLIAQQFTGRNKGLLLISPNEMQQLSYDHLPVISRYNYLLSKAQLVPGKALLIPYLYKMDAGLVKVTVN